MKTSRKKPQPAVVMTTAERRKRSKPLARPAEPAAMIDAEAAKLTATEYCLFHYPTLYTAGTPNLCLQNGGATWTVPIVLATPGHGVLGQVGDLQVDACSGKVVAGTDRRQVVAAGERLYRGKT